MPPRKILSVAMPMHEMKNFAFFLKRNLDILSQQTFKDFDVVITDNSSTGAIKAIVDQYKDKLDIKYYANGKNIGMAKNFNKVLRLSTGKLIKMLLLDDYLYSDQSLEQIVNAFDMEKDGWLVTATDHTKNGKDLFWPFQPKYNDKIHLGENTISSPSVLTIKNEDPLFFDEKLFWLIDCDYYKRLYMRYGEPKILKTVNVINTIGQHQQSNTAAGKEVRAKDYEYIIKKYNERELQKKYYSVMTPLYRFKNWVRKIKTKLF